MSADAPNATAPRPCHTRDLSALIGLLAVIEAESLTGELSPDLSRRIRHRLEKAGLLEPFGTDQDLRQAVTQLNHRLRYALGEYDDPPN